MSFENINDALEFAIEQEKLWSAIYRTHAHRSQSRNIKMLLDELADTEERHEKQLMQFKASKDFDLFPNNGSIKDLHIGDSAEKVALNDSSSIEDVFHYAMKAEEEAYTLYNILSDIELDDECRVFFSALAEEEKKHKFNLEKEYESTVMKDN